MAMIRQGSNGANSEALSLFYKAIELDPEFASAYGMAAYCFIMRRIFLWMTEPVQELAETARLARRAADSGWDDAVALARGGHALGTVVGDLDRAAAMVDRARALNPNLAVAWVASGWLRNLLGEPDKAIEHLAHAMRLSPLDPETVPRRPGWPSRSSSADAMTRLCPARRPRRGSARTTRLPFA
jgi:tetratricopeptide (TPR) repeat protein